jgi:hypothetical protein
MIHMCEYQCHLFWVPCVKYGRASAFVHEGIIGDNTRRGSVWQCYDSECM